MVALAHYNICTSKIWIKKLVWLQWQQEKKFTIEKYVKYSCKRLRQRRIWMNNNCIIIIIIIIKGGGLKIKIKVKKNKIERDKWMVNVLW